MISEKHHQLRVLARGEEAPALRGRGAHCFIDPEIHARLRDWCRRKGCFVRVALEVAVLDFLDAAEKADRTMVEKRK